ncbi:hypothetical protein MANES_08G062933v8 [Manihot esculenta]|uniref:Uncharacterized protein n=1 Tax=Manihot esculenta TaxID=3983 RepID=A0ACB7H976_MANES|nr:hypothetical protein MANES_08G062933v8 [Manihot esculenta]
MTTNNNQTFSLRSVNEKDKLNGTNFIDWSHNLRIILKQEKKLNVLDHPLPIEPARNAIAAQRETFEKKKSDSNDMTCLMLATMTLNLQKQLMDQEAFLIMVHLKKMFQEEARHERFVTTKALTSCKDGTGDFYYYNSFIMNYNMHGMDKSITELHGMLKNAEENIHKTNPVLIVQKGISKKGKHKGKVPPKPKDNKDRPKSKGKEKKAPKPK